MQEKSMERTVQPRVFCLHNLDLFPLSALGSSYGSEWVNLAFSQLPAGKGTALSPALCVCDSGGGQQGLQKFTLETYKFAFSYDIIEQ